MTTGEGFDWSLRLFISKLKKKKKERKSSNLCVFIIYNLFIFREDCSWDERLAQDYKIQQRRIISSISTSCHTGFDMAKKALDKCLAEDLRG